LASYVNLSGAELGNALLRFTNLTGANFDAPHAQQHGTDEQTTVEE